MKFALFTHTVTEFEEGEAMTPAPPPIVMPAKTPMSSIVPAGRGALKNRVILLMILPLFFAWKISERARLQN
jgi:hypothetical protein